MAEHSFPYPHHTSPDVFREALTHSEATTGFTATLIEKDYYSSLVLQHFFEQDTSLVFKGGTCLSKVYADFYRLSEDLDFVMSVPEDSSRAQRRAEVDPVKSMFDGLPTVIADVTMSEVLQGHNESRQYIGYLEYPSAVLEKQERLKVEIGLREPLLIPCESRPARTIAVNPFTDQPLLPQFTVRAMALREAYAEKARAALTRREPAIRDLFDLSYAMKKIGLDPMAPEFIEVVRAKLRVQGNAPVDVSEERKQDLRRQLQGQLRPVLRANDFATFDLDEGFDLLRRVANAVSK